MDHDQTLKYHIPNISTKKHQPSSVEWAQIGHYFEKIFPSIFHVTDCLEQVQIDFLMRLVFDYANGT